LVVVVAAAAVGDDGERNTQPECPNPASPGAALVLLVVALGAACVSMGW